MRGYGAAVACGAGRADCELRRAGRACKLPAAARGLGQHCALQNTAAGSCQLLPTAGLLAAVPAKLSAHSASLLCLFSTVRRLFFFVQNDNRLFLHIFIVVFIVQSAGFSCCGLYSAVVAGPSGGCGVQTVQFWLCRLVPAWLCGAGRAAGVAAVAAPAGPQSRCTAGVTCNLAYQHPPPDTANHINPVQHQTEPTCWLVPLSPPQWPSL